MTGCSIRSLDRFKQQESRRHSLSPLKKDRCGRRNLSMPQLTMRNMEETLKMADGDSNFPVNLISTELSDDSYLRSYKYSIE